MTVTSAAPDALSEILRSGTMNPFLMLLKRPLIVAFVAAVVLGVLSVSNGTANAASSAPTTPVVSAPAVQLVAQSAPVPASTVRVAPAAPAAATYTVKSGDVMGRIAKAHGVSLKSLKDANPQVKDPNRIFPGNVLNLPNGADQSNERSGGPQPQVDSSSGLTASGGSNGVSVADHHWDRLAKCESGGDGLWRANTGNSFYGGLQFTRSTWKAFGGHEFAPNAHQASREEQIAVAERTVDAQGWKAWPACTKKLGMRGVRY
jgi:LysM repeat protein